MGTYTARYSIAQVMSKVNSCGGAFVEKYVFGQTIPFFCGTVSCTESVITAMLCGRRNASPAAIGERYLAKRENYF